MVQYVITPWRNRQQLLKVRSQFFPKHEQQLDVRAGKEDAVLRVEMWKGRGNCPHVVESTAILVKAILDDEIQHNEALRDTSSCAYSLRLVYSTAISRFVTGLVDRQQDRQHKMSMFDVAKRLGLPPHFVELRHQATHEELPTLHQLRALAKEALKWIWTYYWKNLTNGAASHNERREPCRDSVLDHLHAKAIPPEILSDLIKRWGETRLFIILMDIQDAASAARDSTFLLKALRLSRRVMVESGAQGVALEPTRDIEQVQQELEEARQLLETQTEAWETERETMTPSGYSAQQYWPLAWEDWRAILEYQEVRAGQREKQ